MRLDDYHEKMFEGIDFGSGEIAPLRSYFDPERSLRDQLDILREDMFQVTLAGTFTIDVGWYPAGHADGAFTVFLVKDQDWDNPVDQGHCKSYSDAVSTVRRFLNLVDTWGEPDR